MSEGTIASVRVGLVREQRVPDWDHSAPRPWLTGYQKDEVAGAVMARTLGLEGDAVFCRDVHGGEHMAVLAYGADHYASWQRELTRSDFGYGALGENLDWTGFDESSVCIGDTYAIGDDVVVEVSQPRGPCAFISRFWDTPTLLKQVVATRRTGWYLRVKREGAIVKGAPIRRLSRPYPELTVYRALDARTTPAQDVAGLRLLAACEALSPEWRTMLAEKAEKLS